MKIQINQINDNKVEISVNEDVFEISAIKPQEPAKEEPTEVKPVEVVKPVEIVKTVEVKTGMTTFNKALSSLTNGEFEVYCKFIRHDEWDICFDTLCRLCAPYSKGHVYIALARLIRLNLVKRVEHGMYSVIVD